MSIQQLSSEDFAAALPVIGQRLGCESPSELRDVLTILESQGAARVEVVWDQITFQLAGDEPERIVRPAANVLIQKPE